MGDEYSEICYECSGLGNDYHFNGEKYVCSCPTCWVTNQREFEEWEEKE